LARGADGGIVILTMARRPDPKTEALRAQGALHPRPGAVRAPVFDTHPFFDRRDVVQVKYEMLRRVDVDGQPIAASAEAFGFSRPTFYQAAAAFKRAGLPGLLPQKRGPRRAHKLGDAVMAFVQALRAEESVAARALAQRVQERFGVHVHPRSIERALRRAEKKPR
jgi:transposase